MICMTCVLVPAQRQWPLRVRLRPDTDHGPCEFADIVWGTRRPRSAFDAQRPGSDSTLPRAVVVPDADLRLFSWRWLVGQGTGVDGLPHAEQRLHFLACSDPAPTDTPDFRLDRTGEHLLLTISGRINCQCGQVADLALQARGVVQEADQK